MENARPQEGQRRVFWSRFDIDDDKVRHGWKAGRMFCAMSHFLDGSKPCLKIATRGRVACVCARMPLRTEWKGWLPFYDDTHKPRFLVLSEPQFDLADAIGLHGWFMFGQERGDRKPVWAREAPKQQSFRTKREDFMTAFDIVPYLCRVLWKMPFLLEHYVPDATPIGDTKKPELPAVVNLSPNESQAAEDRAWQATKDRLTAVSSNLPASESDLRTKIIRHEIEKAGADQPSSLSQESVLEGVKAIAQPHRNGKKKAK